MQNLAFLLKTYIGDLEYVKRLIPSFVQYNSDNINLYIVAPESELNEFKRYQQANIIFLSEDLFKTNLIDKEINGLSPGYSNQSIIKLAFWELGLCKNYFCIDSDAIFIKNFYIKDFMYNESIPYTILIEDNELKTEPEYYKSYWKLREDKIRLIQKMIGLDDLRMLTCHGMTTFSSIVLQSFNKNYMKLNNFSYSDLLQISPYEFSWYNIWLQYSKQIPIEFREPLFKTFHHENQLKDYIRRGTTIDDIARGFLGVVINSNWQSSSKKTPITFENYHYNERVLDQFNGKELLNYFFLKLIKKLKR